MFGQQNPFGLGRMGSSNQQPNQPPNPRPGGPETTPSLVPGMFGQTTMSPLTSSQSTIASPAADRSGTFDTFGQLASFAATSGMSQFGTGLPNSSNAPIFGSTFRSPAMPTSSSSTASILPSFSSTASSPPSFSSTAVSPPSFSSTAVSPPPSFSSTASSPPSFRSTASSVPSFSSATSMPPSFSFTTNKPVPRGRAMPGFGPVPWLPPAPIFPGGAVNSPVFPPKKNPESGDTATNSLFGQRFGPSTPAANIFGNVSKEFTLPKVTMTPPSSLLALHNSTAEPENSVMKSVASPESSSSQRNKTDQLRSSAARKVTIQRKMPLFTRALAGVGKMEKSGRTRLPSREEKPREPRSRKSSERRSSVTVLDNVETTRVSPKELQQLTSIMCKGVPEHLNNKQTLMQHFGKFGIVTKLICNIGKNSAYIYFRDHDAAASAKASGTVLEPGSKPMLILWTKSSSLARQKSDTLSAIAESPKAAKTYADPSEVNEELASMAQSYSFEPPKLLHRPKNSPKPRQHNHKPSEISETQQQEDNRFHVNTSEERYRALDNRDKLLRQGVKKQSDLATAKATIGTCPDMCPEKERYMREHRNQLHPFEVQSDSENKSPTADHRKIIKEYSRSSADQEEPLPHELRPVNVLSMTMGYLVCNIMDKHEQGLSSAEEWYDFVWNRTRAIRKDITQQHLCDHAAVALVEKCARFHIHCAARLCEEDMSIFDQKINNENLTNCLQTLKYFYADMEAKGERCPAEAEFRAYEVLLNLNEGDILRQVQLLAPDIRDSPHVLQALRFYAALNANNYVRFFKLVRATSYLNACILQRYFNQVRLKALYAVVRAYSPVNHSGQFPVPKFIEILGFEDDNDARDFVNHYGLATDSAYVVLDRYGLSQPENPAPLRRSMKIIESKRQCLVGEVINDGPLPPNPLDYHVPYSSFDDQGTLSRESEEITKLKECSQQLADPTTEPQVQTEDLVAAKHVEEQRANLLQMSFAVMESLIDEVLVEGIKRGIFEVLKLHEFERRLTLETCSVIIQAVCPQLIKEIAEQTYAAEKIEELKERKRREEAEQARQEHIRQFNAEYSEEIWEIVLLGVAKAQVQELVTQEFDAATEAARQLSISRSCEQLSHDYLEDHVSVSLWQICNDIYTEQTEFRKQTLSRVAEKLGVWRSVAAFRKWRNFVARRKRTRRSMETFPSCNLRPVAKRSLGEKTMRVLSPLQIMQDRKYLDRILNVSTLNYNIRESFSHMWIDVISLAKKHVAYGQELNKRKTSLQNLYWSILFSFPPMAQGSSDVLLSLVDWLKAKFAQPGSHPGSNSTKSDVLNTVVYEDSLKFAIPHTTAVCIKAVDGCLPDTDASISLLQGTQALIFILQIPKSGIAHNQKYWADQQQRLTAVLQAKPKNPAIPLMVIAIGQEERPVDSKLIAEVLRADDSLARKLISAFSVVTLASSLSEPSSTQALTRSLQWAAQHCPSPPNLRIETFKEFMNKAVTKFYSSQVFKDLIGNAERRHQPPDVLINAYNHAINHAAATLSDEALMDVSWPQAEFSGIKTDLPKPNWNTVDVLQELKRKALFCLLPTFSVDVRTCKDLAGLLRITWNYIDQLQDAHWGSKMVLASRIQSVFQESSTRKLAKEALPHESVAWSEIVDVLIDHSLLMPLMSDDLQVVYDPNKMECFTESEDWLRATLWCTKPSMKLESLSYLTQPAKRKTDTVDSSPKRKLTKDPFQSPSKCEELQQSCTELKRQLNIEKEKAKKFEEFLAAALQEGNMTNI